MKILLPIFLLMLASLAQAECLRDTGTIYTVCGPGPCAKDRFGKTYCAPHIDGSALVDRYQNVVCSVGKCERDIRDNIVCSSEPGGDVIRNLYGEVDCFGECQLADAAYCERTVTGPRDQDGKLVRDPRVPLTERE